jgi:AsmA protein
VKLILKILAAIVVLVVVAVLLLVLFFDLNFLKPRIEQTAREQGFDLRINGDLSWAFWPSLGVSVEDIRVAPASAPDKPVALLKQASLLVEVRPLFSGQVKVHHVRVDGAEINLVVDAKGKGNWEVETRETEAASAGDSRTDSSGSQASEPATESDDAESFTLAVERISLLNSALRYSDAQSGQQISVENVQLVIGYFNLQGEPFDVDLTLETRLQDSVSQSSLDIALDTSNRLKFAQDFSALEVNQGDLKVTINQRGKVAASYKLKADQLQKGAHYTGEVQVPSFDARQLLAALGSPLETRNKNALSKVELNLQFAGDPKQIRVEPLNITLDKTRLDGKFAITDLTTQAIQLILKGDAINLDDYLPPPAPEPETATTASSGDEELIPLQTLRDLKANVQLEMKSLTVMETPLEDLRVNIKADNGLVELQQADARAYEGTLAARAQLDARSDTAVMQFDSKVNNVQLAPALKNLELDKNVQLTGAVNADVNAKLRGVTFNQLMDSLVAEANFSGAEWKFAPLNIEQQFCELVDKVNKLESDPNRVWESFTQMRELSGKITMANRVLSVDNFNAGVHQLLLGTQGKLDLGKQSYDFTLPLKLLEEETSERGCRVASNYWINRSLSLLRCRGSLESVNPLKDCGLDSKGLTSLTKDFAEYKLREKHGDKIDAAEQKVEEKKEELLKKLDEKLGGEGDSKKSKDLLKGLLKQAADKQTKSSSSSTSAVAE